MQLTDIDRSELILESYRITDIDLSECRSIFLDWALKLPIDCDQSTALELLIATYADQAPDHPMSSVLRESLGQAVRTGRRGGWRGRVAD